MVPKDYTSIAALAELVADSKDVGRNFGKVLFTPRTIRVGGRRTSVRLEPEFWTAIDFVVAVEKIDRDAFFLDIEQRYGRFAFSSKIRSVVVSTLLKIALLDRIRCARLAASNRSGPPPRKRNEKKQGAEKAPRKPPPRPRARV
ncbi:MAG: ribbon-helix-helix domain-containing protein [Telmatospirillum sp.]|nr:ribbon-helix-helix domain-containing protein [Telmatospirillum sp.]